MRPMGRESCPARRTMRPTARVMHEGSAVLQEAAGEAGERLFVLQEGSRGTPECFPMCHRGWASEARTKPATP